MGDLWLFVTKCTAVIAGSYKRVTALFDATMMNGTCDAVRYQSLAKALRA
jgi:hypothetical protein